ncbi:hypothetical protein CSR02_08090 [Acetobacter pomorum]|uniref:Uncharacterized protein n=1 Tax=Acetobacter pomorum TaxID=65959 RepID=A0A2G4REH2_9PROT|nr:hypothetical protein [Acetobacter pomorum]KDE20142.1 hypothetical protein AZ09_07445 [Acetobacter aceti 1023]PHY94145.1 hypothetical protein CSR02_08090 [Acetobacter pomorum]GBR45380.1 hypothetical protein AA11825_0021 [Acetobacter pomorum DSM 11825]
MTETAGQTPEAGSNRDVPEDLERCNMVIQHAVEHLRNEKYPPLAVASALLGNSVGILAQIMDKDTVLRILDSASQSVRSGEVHASVRAQTGQENEKA